MRLFVQTNATASQLIFLAIARFAPNCLFLYKQLFEAENSDVHDWVVQWVASALS